MKPGLIFSIDFNLLGEETMKLGLLFISILMGNAWKVWLLHSHVFFQGEINKNLEAYCVEVLSDLLKLYASQTNICSVFVSF